jgi:hypothetical protein
VSGSKTTRDPEIEQPVEPPLNTKMAWDESPAVATQSVTRDVAAAAAEDCQPLVAPITEQATDPVPGIATVVAHGEMQVATDEVSCAALDEQRLLGASMVQPGVAAVDHLAPSVQDVELGVDRVADSVHRDAILINQPAEAGITSETRHIEPEMPQLMCAPLTLPETMIVAAILQPAQLQAESVFGEACIGQSELFKQLAASSGMATVPADMPVASPTRPVPAISNGQAEVVAAAAESVPKQGVVVDTMKAQSMTCSVQPWWMRQVCVVAQLRGTSKKLPSMSPGPQSVSARTRKAQRTITVPAAPTADTPLGPVAGQSLPVVARPSRLINLLWAVAHSQALVHAASACALAAAACGLLLVAPELGRVLLASLTSEWMDEGRASFLAVAYFATFRTLSTWRAHAVQAVQLRYARVQEGLSQSLTRAAAAVMRNSLAGPSAAEFNGNADQAADYEEHDHHDDADAGGHFDWDDGAYNHEDMEIPPQTQQRSPRRQGSTRREPYWLRVNRMVGGASFAASGMDARHAAAVAANGGGGNSDVHRMWLRNRVVEMWEAPIEHRSLEARRLA